MPETCKNWLCRVNSWVNYSNQLTIATSEIYQVVGVKAPGERWNPLTKTMISKCSFLWFKGPVNNRNVHKAQK